MSKRDRYKSEESHNKQKREGRKRYYEKTANLYPRSYYTVSEDTRILEHNITDHELSKEIKHSVKSIQSRRSRLNRMCSLG